jgi:hypothetical protein
MIQRFTRCASLLPLILLQSGPLLLSSNACFRNLSGPCYGKEYRFMSPLLLWPCWAELLLRLSSLYIANTVPAQNTLCMEISACGELPAPLVNGQASRMYPINPVQYLYISCYVTANNQVLSYLLLRLLPHAGNTVKPSLRNAAS